MDFSSYVTVIQIVIICYLIGAVCKVISKIPDKWIPVIVAVAGGILAIPAMYLIADFPAKDIVTAISIGIASGFASTGVNQLYKQTIKKNEK